MRGGGTQTIAGLLLPLILEFWTWDPFTSYIFTCDLEIQRIKLKSNILELSFAILWKGEAQHGTEHGKEISLLGGFRDSLMYLIIDSAIEPAEVTLAFHQEANISLFTGKVIQIGFL